MTQLFTTQRERILRAYAEAKQEVIAHTIPYHSTGVIEFDVVDASEAGTPVAMAVARRAQVISFFGYGVGEQVYLGGANNVRATDAETNLAKGRSTNGAQDYVIEGIGFHNRGLRVAYTGADLTALQALVNDPAVESMLVGDGAVFDPAAILVPPQAQSPFNLEQAMFQAVIPYCSIELLFDRKRVEKIGTIDLMPQAGAQSYLRANGSPESANRYRIPEGYLWRKDGQPDCELEATVMLQRDIVVPINQTATWAADPANVVPSKIWLEVVLRLYGLAVDMPSAN
jgi:hypothetical protein